MVKGGDGACLLRMRCSRRATDDAAIPAEMPLLRSVARAMGA